MIWPESVRCSCRRRSAHTPAGNLAAKITSRAACAICRGASFRSQLQKLSASLRAIRGCRSRSVIRLREVYLAAFKQSANDLVASVFCCLDDAALLIKRAESEGIRSAP